MRGCGAGQATVPAAAVAPGAAGVLPLAAALGVFSAGEAGNGWHHWRLAQLRPKGGATKAYALPSGGLFDSVVRFNALLPCNAILPVFHTAFGSLP